MSTQLGFSFRYQRESYWLQPEPNGTFSGSLSRVGKGEAIASIGHNIITPGFYIPSTKMSPTDKH